MTEEEKQLYDNNNKRTIPQLILQLIKLILILILSILIKGLKIVWRFLVFLVDVAVDAMERLGEWWNANDTQEKVKKIKAAIKKGCITLGKWCVIAAVATAHGIAIGAVATWHGLVYGTKATIQGIIHLKPTVVRTGKLIVSGTKATIAWIKRCARGIRLFHIKRKRAYMRFRRNKGFKGLIVDSSNAVRDSIKMFMEEDQEEATPDAVTEDDIIEEELDERIENKKARKFGKKFFEKVKEIVEDE